MAQPSRIYLDACAINRLTDDLGQARVRAEAEAVEAILALNAFGVIRWTASAVLEAELGHNPHTEQRARALGLLSQAPAYIWPDESTYVRAYRLAEQGFGLFDALHLACAEEAAADFFLSTDDRLLRKAARGVGKLQIQSMNPVDWIKEIRR
jgi:predicted nucleic acid-binding protein